MLVDGKEKKKKKEKKTKGTPEVNKVICNAVYFGNCSVIIYNSVVFNHQEPVS